ncbi:MAG TPA: HAMP domain-containing sensor histidine kinase [Solirubrobacteraceae bacterium]
MISRTSVRWRLVVWVTGVLLAVSAVVFVVVYEQTGNELRAQIDHDVSGDAAQLAQAVRALHSQPTARLLPDIGNYLRAQPFSGTSSLLFAGIPGHGTASNHPELVGVSSADDHETVTEQSRENALGRALLTGTTGLTTRQLADIGMARFDERIVSVDGLHVRVGAGEPLAIVTRADRSVARSFVIAGALALLLALIASYLAGASVSRPLRRMARVAARVDDGDLNPRMTISRGAGTEVQVLAESFNHMLDRLSAAFAAQRDFIADASHELRTPLTVIGGQLEVLAAQDHPAPEEVRRVQRLVAAEIARTSRLVDDMLLLARSERRDFLRLEEIELAPFIEELWGAASLGDDRRFELGPIPQANLSADPDRVAQALRNLIRNAVEHTNAPTGLVRLEVAARPGGRVRFVVLDDGPGIDPDQLDSVFERFHRTDSARSRKAGGAGLGLAIVLAIARAHGGQARAVATATGGARIELELPGLYVRTPTGARAAAARNPSLASAAGGREHRRGRPD